jgi:novel protein kinase C epsilon type
MLLGQTPFRGDDEDEIFDAILEDEPLYLITHLRKATCVSISRLCNRSRSPLGSPIPAHIKPIYNRAASTVPS